MYATMHNPASPGELLKEFLGPRKSCAFLPRVNDIVRGKRAISADTALWLGIYFGLPAQFWLNLQNDYDLRLAAKSSALAKVNPRKKAA